MFLPSHVIRRIQFSGTEFTGVELDDMQMHEFVRVLDKDHAQTVSNLWSQIADLSEKLAKSQEENRYYRRENDSLIHQNKKKRFLRVKQNA